MRSELKNTALFSALSNVIEDLADLFKKEVRLAREEISGKIASKIRAVAFFSVAGVLAFVVFLLLVQAAVFALVALGVAAHWACLLIATALAAAAAIFFAIGQSEIRESATPDRTVRQINNDIATAKEIMS